jgi:Fe-S-cluster containining protein
MRDNFAQKWIKNTIRIYYLGSLWLNRKNLKKKGLPHYQLTGKCEGCGKCCENPGIQVGFLVTYFETCRKVYIFWQKKINGFIFQKQDKENQVLYFTCNHFDKKTRLCDSYDSRPGMCRDYPRNLLYASIPDFFKECGYRPIDKNAEKFKIALDKVDIDETKKKKIKDKLFLE